MIKAHPLIATQRLPYWAKFILVAVIYFIGARIGLLVPFDGEIATLIWPANAIALAVLLIYGLNLWPALTVGALAVAIYNNHSIPLTIAVAIAHTAESTLSAYAIRRYTDFDSALERLSDVRAFVICAVLLGPMVGASVGAFGFFFSPEGTSAQLARLWWHWYVGHTSSIMILVPFFLTWWANPTIRFNQRRFLELLLTISGLMIVSFLIFVPVSGSTISSLPLGHVVFPFLLLIALRFSPREVATASVLVSTIAILGTVIGSGPFSRPQLDINLLMLSTFIVSVMLTSLIISTIMTQRSNARSALARSHANLEDRVAERTAALVNTNQQLQAEIDMRRKYENELAEARDHALEALQLKNQILANVSHDARTPLNIIMLYTELMQRRYAETMEARQHDMLDSILHSAEELLQFIDNLLDEAQLQKKDVIPDQVSLNCRQWIRERIESFQPLAEQKGIQIKLYIDENFPETVYVDPLWLKQILNNLLSNAIKFTFDGMIQLDVLRSEAGFWCMRVCDTGAGIPPEALPHIFDPFWQVDGSTTRLANRGVGLGLSIVKHRLTLMGGHIEVESQEGEGSVFTAYLPLEPADAME